MCQTSVPLSCSSKSPPKTLDRVMRDHSYAIGPDFLCFETFYQAVAASWPNRMQVVDIGGCYGIQGWLFGDFRRYICVDSYEMASAGWRIGSRCELPDNGLHVVMDGFDYLRGFHDFKVDMSDTLFLCSAVPNEKLRKEVSRMQNSVVWYPGQDMVASGDHADDTISEFRRLRDGKWVESAEKMVWEAIDNRKRVIE